MFRVSEMEAECGPKSGSKGGDSEHGANQCGKGPCA